MSGGLAIRARAGGLAMLAVLVCASELHAAPGAAGRKPAKRVVVATFQGEHAARARSAVLTTLSEHLDVEVVALEDVAMAGRRLKAEPTQPAGRRKLSSELGIHAWLDGSLDDDRARFTLKAPNGRVIASTTLEGKDAENAAELAGAKIWSAMGAWLSVRERNARLLQAQADLALEKIRAREKELARQRQVAQVRAAERAARFQQAQVLAREKRAAFAAELERQRTLVEERRLLAERQREAEERRRAEAEEAEFLASLEESGPQPPGWNGGPPGAAAWSAPAHSAWQAPAAEPPPPAAHRFASPELTPGAQRSWTAEGGYAQPGSQPAYVPPPRAMPSTSVDMEGVSPATRRWLEQQQAR